jgi:hypothetical protein
MSMHIERSSEMEAEIGLAERMGTIMESCFHTAQLEVETKPDGGLYLPTVDGVISEEVSRFLLSVARH